MRLLEALLGHPLTRGMDLNDPQTTVLRRRIIREKRFSRLLYEEWYTSLAMKLPAEKGPVLEIGSGAGFMSEHVPNLITSEAFFIPDVDVVLNGMQLPFGDKMLGSIVMTNVLHHIPNVRRFLGEAARCVCSGGAIVMIEPWVTPWSRLIYKHLHHEPFMPAAEDWTLSVDGPLSGSNGALPWILFARDTEQFKLEFPEWQLRTVRPLMPFRYLVSGGVSMRSLMPGWTFGWWRGLEKVTQPWLNTLAMFAEIVLERVECGEEGKTGYHTLQEDPQSTRKKQSASFLNPE
jgi:hypothetical protein